MSVQELNIQTFSNILYNIQFNTILLVCILYTIFFETLEGRIVQKTLCDSPVTLSERSSTET